MCVAFVRSPYDSKEEGVMVKGVTNQTQDISKGKGEQPKDMIHIGINATERMRDEILQRELRALNINIKVENRASGIVILGWLPLSLASETKSRKIVQLNAWLRSWCKRERFGHLTSIPGQVRPAVEGHQYLAESLVETDLEGLS